MKQEKISKIYWNCLKELYETSEHISGVKVNFDKIVKEAPINEQGQSVINFDEYYLSKEAFGNICDKYFGKNIKGISEMERRRLNFHIYLGSSPTSNRENWETLKLNYDK